jgi:hypothetical protein
MGVDPGDDTGIGLAVLYAPDETVPSGVDTYTHPMLNGHRLWLQMHAVTDYDNAPKIIGVFMRRAEHLRDTYAPDTPIQLTIEKFIITKTAMDANATWSSEVTGMAIAAPVLLPVPNVRVITTQQPNGMKNIIHANKVLQTLQITRRGDGMTQHEKDAIGHVLVRAAALAVGRLPGPVG